MEKEEYSSSAWAWQVVLFSGSLSSFVDFNGQTYSHLDSIIGDRKNTKALHRNVLYLMVF